MFGIAIMLTLLINFFTPLINTIVTGSAKEFTIVDIGWFASEQVLLNSPINLYIIIAIVAVNLLMLLLRFTRTINIDLWSWWILLMAGSMIFAITEIHWLGVLIAIIIFTVTLVIGDIYAPSLEHYYGVSGVSNPQTQYVTWAPVTHLINFVLNKIPGVRRVHIFYEEIQYKLGFFSEPLVMGFLLGFIIGLITRFKTIMTVPQQSLLFALGKGLELAIIMVLLPRFVNILYRGLGPAVSNIISFINRKITKRELYLGMDAIMFAGHPSVIILSIIVIPLSAYIATVLPGNNIIPAADLIIIPFILVWAVAPSRGDIIRSFISAIIIVPLTLWIASDMGSLFTSFFTRYDIEVVEGIKNISSYGGGSNWLFWIILQIIKPILNLFA
jgi:PTS system galactitol-specific IIC component